MADELTSSENAPEGGLPHEAEPAPAPAAEGAAPEQASTQEPVNGQSEPAQEPIHEEVDRAETDQPQVEPAPGPDPAPPVTEPEANPESQPTVDPPSPELPGTVTAETVTVEYPGPDDLRGAVTPASETACPVCGKELAQEKSEDEGEEAEGE